MSRLALRYYLPILQVIFIVGFLVHWQVARYEAAHQTQQEVISARGHDVWRSPFAEVFKTINEPVYRAVLALEVMLPPESEITFGILFYVAIFVFWYGIGRFFDRLRGLLTSRPIYERSKALQWLAKLAALVAAVATGFGIFLIVRKQYQDDLYGYPLLVWAGLAGLMLVSELRRPRVSSESVSLDLKS